jgi:hypothetical protein
MSIHRIVWRVSLPRSNPRRECSACILPAAAGVSPAPGWSCELPVAAETAALISRSSHHGIVHLAIQFDGIGVQFPDAPQRKFSFLIPSRGTQCACHW